MTYVDLTTVPINNRYVVWLDIMGMQNTMSRSLQVSGNFVLKFHAAALECNDEDSVSLYPIMDGLYIIAERKSDILNFLGCVFKSLQTLFLTEKKVFHKFLIRGALAYGPIMAGKDIDVKVNSTLAKHSSHASTLAVGLPIIQAFKSEGSAPPFGIFVHQSARAMAPPRTDPIPFRWWRWKMEDTTRVAFRASLFEYFDWCKKNHHDINYNPERIDVHKEMANQYFD